MEGIKKIKCCPVEIALKHVGKKWTINIIRDLFFGKKRFKDFLNSNPKLSTKVLSARLKEMVIDSIIEKNVINSTPIIIEYTLTQKGRALNTILYQLALFSIEHYPNEVFLNSKNVKNTELNAIKKMLLTKIKG